MAELDGLNVETALPLCIGSNHLNKQFGFDEFVSPPALRCCVQRAPTMSFAFIGPAGAGKRTVLGYMFVNYLVSFDALSLDNRFQAGRTREGARAPQG